MAGRNVDAIVQEVALVTRMIKMDHPADHLIAQRVDHVIVPRVDHVIEVRVGGGIRIRMASAKRRRKKCNHHHL
jgi:hypothetical protein